MSMYTRAPGYKPKPDERFRVAPEAEIVDLLLLVSGVFDVETKGRAAAEANVKSAIERWIDAGLGYRTAADGGRLFDPAEVVNLMKWRGVAGEDAYWRDHFVQTHRDFVDEFKGQAQTPRRFDFTFRRTFDVSGFEEGANLRLRMPVPLTEPYLRDLRSDFVVPDAWRDAATVRDNYVELRLKKGAEQSLTLGGEYAFTAGFHAPDALTERERETCLKKSEGFIRVTPRIEALSAQLDAGDPRATLAAFWDYMMNALYSGMVRYAHIPPEAPGDFVLEHGWYDCQLGAALFASLCRARGVPARLINGHLLYRTQPISHYWAEAWIDGEGWLPFDVICWDLSMAGENLAWRDLFAGAIDYRLATQCFPTAFTGPMTVRFPPAWQMLQKRAGAGVEITYQDVDTGAILYRDYAEARDRSAD
jgi:transglutaminase-like putative cysteine protease